MPKTRPARFLVPWTSPSTGPRLTTLLRSPGVAAVELRGAALGDSAACRALAAAIHAASNSAASNSAASKNAESAAAELPPLVVLDAHPSPTGGTLPDELRPPDPRHLAMDLAAGGEDFEVTLKVLTWARHVAQTGVDLVLSPRLDRTQPPLGPGDGDPDVTARLTAAWTGALLAAGLIACAGPVTATQDDDDWAPFGAALAHGLEAVFLDAATADTLAELRDRADDVVVIGPPAGDADQAERSLEAGVDLVRLSNGLGAEEIEAILDSLSNVQDDPSRVDALREDWLV